MHANRTKQTPATNETRQTRRRPPQLPRTGGFFLTFAAMALGLMMGACSSNADTREDQDPEASEEDGTLKNDSGAAVAPRADGGIGVVDAAPFVPASHTP